MSFRREFEVCARDGRIKWGLTLGPVDHHSFETLVCANFDGPIGGLAQHGRSDAVKVKSCFSLAVPRISPKALMTHSCVKAI